MRRLALIFVLLVGSAAGLVASAATGDDSHTYYLELDNAFGLVKGSEVKVAGVTAGKITDFFINSDKRAVAKIELSGPVSVLGEGTICSTEPQSLIAEYFVDCSPKGDPIQVADGSDEDHAEDPDIPVEQTRQTVQNDLVLSALRLPFRQRLTLIINEFGTALAGNADNLNAAIRRGAPALEQTRQVFDLLAKQNTIIRDLNVNSDIIIGKLAERRQDVVDFINETKDTAEATAARRDDLSQNFALLDDFLAELRPTMVELNGLAVQGTPLAANLRRAAPGLTTLSRNLPAFNPSATDALVSLGKTSTVGQRALQKGRDEIKTLAKASRKSFSVADNLAKFLRDIDDPRRAVETDARANVDTGRKGETGYTGMEGLLNYVYYQPLAINQFDEIGHFLHFTIFEIGTGPCASYNAGEYDPDGPGPKPGSFGVPNLDGSGSTTDILQANRCVAWLGPNQPGISQEVDVPPYDPKACPEGSTDLELCNPAGPSTTAAPEPRRQGVTASTGGNNAAG
ncbi:MAG: MCE family protein, partial [Solirubrobacterales bacterium]|nr:MCE family protein [Solirubrobacterales bacterium]